MTPSYGSEAEEAPEEKTTKQSARQVTEMGTYVTQSAFSVGGNTSGETSLSDIKRPPLRQFMMEGNFSVAENTLDTQRQQKNSII